MVSSRPYVVTQCGVDDLTIGFDMTGSGCIGRLEARPGLESRRVKMLGDRSSWGSFAHLLGRSVCFWRREHRGCTSRRSWPTTGRSARCQSSVVRSISCLLAWRLWVTSFEPAWVTRLVAVDAVCTC